jgi:CO/xanthine dehydrogenase Mo-binding subunit
MNETPSIEITIINSGEALGEVGDPDTLPTVVKAVFALIGKRILSLPMNV